MLNNAYLLDMWLRNYSHYDSYLGQLFLAFFFHSRTVHLDIIKVLLPTDIQDNFFKRTIKIYIKTAPTCSGVFTIIRERTM